ncbi:hypothetical protein LCGC14_2875170, partial [marine sediment metagenome]
MHSRTLLIALALSFAAASAQTTPPAAFPYQGTVTGTDVYVRSGPGDSYPCLKLSSPAKVKVVGQAFGWL